MGNSASVGRGLRDFLSKTVRETMLVAADNVTNATPVDTGHAASNWVLSTGAPYAGVCGSRKAVDTSAQRAGIEKISRYDIGRDGPRIYLRNNVLYLQYLDKGWSQQAEPGFVAKAIRGAAFRAPAGRKRAVGRMLRNIARAAYIKGV